MTSLVEPDLGTRRFIDDLTAAGAPARLEGARVLYQVLAVGGAFAGQQVDTGVSVSEVQSWPMAPPHWVHLRDSVVFAETNADVTDCPPGWVRHSRDFAFDMSAPPATAWLRHVRGFVSIAIEAAA